MATIPSNTLSASDLTEIPDSVDELFRNGFTTLTPTASIESNLLESWGALYLQLAIPGIDISTVRLETVARTVVVWGEYRIATVEGAWYVRHDLPVRDMHASFQIPDEIDGDRATATYKEGVLTIRLPKVAHLRRCSIPIQSA